MKLIATVDRIISCTAKDGGSLVWLKIHEDQYERRIFLKNGDSITQGYQFQYESEIPPHLCDPDYKTVYETIDKALQDSTDNILGKVLSALQGRINPLEARRIIIDRLLLK